MNRVCIISAVGVVLSCTCGCTAVRPQSPARFTSGFAVTPDLPQNDYEHGIIPHQGRYHCGPTAVANALIWLDATRFPELVDFDTSSREGQCRLIALMGSPQYCNTREKKGTGPVGLMSGIEKYIRSRGYDAKVAWRGWRNGGKYAAGDLTDARFLRNALAENNILLLNVGWYRRDGARTVKRFAGHYVTAVGYDFSDEREPFVYIHDPSGRSGKETRHEKCLLVKKKISNTSNPGDGRVTDTGGYLELAGIVLKKGADCALVDGAVVITVGKKQQGGA